MPGVADGVVAQVMRVAEKCVGVTRPSSLSPHRQRTSSIAP